MNLDISGFLKGWEYEPASVTARWVNGRDGTVKVQLRLDLGLFQMEIEGRPDGTKPRGYPSLLDYYLTIDKTSGAGKGVRLSPETCSELQQEAMQYYYRYLAFYSLQHYEGVIADTEHNLKLFEFVAKHTDDEDLSWQFQQFYPYVRMMNARARAEHAVADKKYEEAIKALHKALDDIQAFWKEYGENDAPDTSQEIDVLTDLLGQVQKKKPMSAQDRLRDQLAREVAAENYEKAAVLRDKLNELAAKRAAGSSAEKPHA